MSKRHDIPFSSSERRKLSEVVSRSHRRRGPVVDFADATKDPAEELESSIITAASYRDGERERSVDNLADALNSVQEREDDSAFIWLGLVDPSEAEFDEIAQAFNLPETAVEDALRFHERAKIENFRDVTLAILKPVVYVDSTEDIVVHDVSMFIGPHYVITVRSGNSDLPAFVRSELESDPQTLQWGPFAVLYRTLDALFDDYLEVVRAISTDIEDIEKQVFSPDHETNTERIYTLKREVLEFKRAHQPLLRPLDSLKKLAAQRGEDAGTKFADATDHALEVNDALENYDRLLTDVLNAELAQVGVRQNEDARKMSAWAAIAIIPTTVFSWYGQNWEHMPELDYRYGYFISMALVVVACVLLYIGFKRNRWL